MPSRLYNRAVVLLMRKIFFQIYHDLIQIYQSAGSIALNLEIATTTFHTLTIWDDYINSI